MIDIEQLKRDPTSFLSLGIEDDPVLIKLEAYRLHKAGYEVAEIVKAFGYTRQHWHALWGRLKREGTKAFNNKNCGSVARKRTTKTEAAVIRAKALSPEKSDDDLGKEFGMERTTIYRLLKEHGIQDLHKAIKR